MGTDKIKHFIMCFGLSLIYEFIFGNYQGWFYAMSIGVAVEGAQAEGGNVSPFSKVFWRKIKSKDSRGDLLADAIGSIIGDALGLLLRRLIL